MEKEILKLEDMQGYGFGLKGILTVDKREAFACEDWVDNEEIFKKNAIWQMCGYAPGDLNIYLGEGIFDGFLWRNGSTYVNFHTGILPVLRPTDLTKPILIKGEEKLPLMELAKLVINGNLFIESDIHDKIISISNDKGYYFKNITGNIFGLTKSYNDFYFDTVPLLKWLYTNRYDVNGLIERGLAVDVNTLPNNPYNN